jgi:hypothetical protein
MNRRKIDQNEKERSKIENDETVVWKWWMTTKLNKNLFNLCGMINMNIRRLKKGKMKSKLRTESEHQRKRDQRMSERTKRHNKSWSRLEILTEQNNYEKKVDD